ncbi:MAG TPA: alpha/beta hydrolase [Thermoanaerobaculia bacterium]|jgi:pimeloyl-ACP methyl ester carboxylesterase|nr:alpha/beta hydrolase [Thermoanaerobaculia bacterium]
MRATTRKISTVRSGRAGWRFGIFALAAIGLAGCASGGGSGTTAAARPAGVARLELKPCTIEGATVPARCGTYEVFEHREARTGRKIGLKVVVLPATGPNPAPDPVVYFAGGPGESVTEYAAEFTSDNALLKRRDIVLVDVRGTGGSNPLYCSYQKDGSRQLGLLEGFLPLAGVEACRKELEGENDLKTYTTPVLVDDVYEVVTALGYTQVNVNGGSYGSFASQAYMRRHPEGVRTAVLEGVVAYDTRLPLHFAHDAQAALDGLFAECAAEATCASAFPHLADDLREVLARVKASPARTTVVDPKTGKDVEREFAWATLVQTLRYMSYSSASAQEIPLAIHLAAKGDYSVLARNAAVYGGALGNMPDGLYLSITCPEYVARIHDEDVAPAVEGTYLGDYRVRQQREACALWPKGPLPPNYWEPLRSTIPTLLVTGERDPVTPAKDTLLVAKTLPNSRTIIVPDGAHGSNGLTGRECIEDIESRFVDQGDFSGLDIEGCVAAIRRPPFPTEPPAAAIALSAAQQARYPGTYLATEPAMKIDVQLLDGLLFADTPFQPHMRITPTSATEFRIEGAPFGYGFRFELDGEDGPAQALLLLQPGQPPTRLERKVN